MSWIKPIWVQIKAKLLGFLGTFKLLKYKENKKNFFIILYNNFKHIPVYNDEQVILER